MTTGQRIKNLRASLGVNQDEAGKWLGVSDVQWGRFEKGTSTLNADQLRIIADKFNVTSDYLLGRDTPDEATLLAQDREGNYQPDIDLYKDITGVKGKEKRSFQRHLQVPPTEVTAYRIALEACQKQLATEKLLRDSKDDQITMQREMIQELRTKLQARP